MPVDAYLNRVATAVPAHDVHTFFLGFAGSMLGDEPRKRAIFSRMAGAAGIDHRFSCHKPADDPEGPIVDAGGVFRRGAFPGTAKRMALFEHAAPVLAQQAVDRLGVGTGRQAVTHLIVTSCTGFSAPGLDLELVARCGLSPSVERTIIGFMGCYAAVNALKLARHIVRSEPAARVLVVNIELCTLHIRETDELEKLLSFCLWGDGCAASLVTAEPVGLRLDSFYSTLAPESAELMSWRIGDDGFDMVLSGQVPGVIKRVLDAGGNRIFGGPASAIDLWAVHPGGRSVLDAVERALGLGPDALAISREVLQSYGNMSSATVMFVMEGILRSSGNRGKRGCGMAFGPGLTAETMLFQPAA